MVGRYWSLFGDTHPKQLARWLRITVVCELGAGVLNLASEPEPTFVQLLRAPEAR